MQLDWEHAPELRACAWSEYAQRESGLYNFVKEVHVAPDGLCVLTNSEDNVLRVFEAPQQQQQQQQASSDPPRELHAVLRCPEGETVHSCAWYPFMTSANPTSCVFASTSRDQPVHMWDAYTGKLRASYCAYDHMDEVAPANSVCFSMDGIHFYAGYNRMIRVFDVSYPGRAHVDRPTSATRKSKEGQRGIISCIAASPADVGLHAAGSFSRCVGMYDDRGGPAPLALLHGHVGGVTHVRFSGDGRLLFSAARSDPSILTWDVRHMRECLHRIQRVSRNNQKIGFDVDPLGSTLVTGSQEGAALVYDLRSAMPELVHRIVCRDVVNSVSLHGATGLLALGTGERRYRCAMEDSDAEAGRGGVHDADEVVVTSAASGQRIHTAADGLLLYSVPVRVVEGEAAGVAEPATADKGVAEAEEWVAESAAAANVETASSSAAKHVGTHAAANAGVDASTGTVAGASGRDNATSAAADAPHANEAHADATHGAGT